MGKEGKKALVPKLRFPEFAGQALSEVRLSDVTTESSIRNGDGVPAGRVMGVSKALGIVPMEERIVASDIGRYKLVRKDWFAYNPMRLNIGSIARWHGDADILVSPDYVVFQCRDEPDSGIEPSYLDHFRQSAAWDAFVSEGGDGGVRIRIYYKDIARLELALPQQTEQQKIADCLGSLDELITAQGRKVEALKTYKRGLMQQLFPREGETLPRLRFPEFRDAPEWENKLLGQLIEEFREKSQTQDQYEVLTSARFGLVRQRDYYDNDAITERDNIGFNVMPPNYITYRSRSDDRRFYFNENNLGVTGIISTYYPVFRIREGSNKFVIELLALNSELVGKRSVGTSQTVLSLNELRRIELPIPSEAEQNMVANVFASLDEDIAVEAAKLNALRTHKNGLMQQLFPSLEEA